MRLWIYFNFKKIFNCNFLSIDRIRVVADLANRYSPLFPARMYLVFVFSSHFLNIFPSYPTHNYLLYCLGWACACNKLRSWLAWIFATQKTFFSISYPAFGRRPWVRPKWEAAAKMKIKIWRNERNLNYLTVRRIFSALFSANFFAKRGRFNE